MFNGESAGMSSQKHDVIFNTAHIPITQIYNEIQRQRINSFKPVLIVNELVTN